MTMTRYRCEPHPRLPGWSTWAIDEPGFFVSLLGEFAVRREGPATARVRWWPAAGMSNVNGVIHGGALLGFADTAIYAAANACGIGGAQAAVTVDCSCQFLSPARLGEPVDALIEILRETGRMAFLRGTMEESASQGRIAAFAAVMRKPSAP